VHLRREKGLCQRRGEATLRRALLGYVGAKRKTKGNPPAKEQRYCQVFKRREIKKSSVITVRKAMKEKRRRWEVSCRVESNMEKSKENGR